jgi:hypothetical protein
MTYFNEFGQARLGWNVGTPSGGGGGNSIITSGLILNLDASNVSSYPGTGTIWTDLSGNNKNGTLVTGTGNPGPTWSSTNGGIFSFDGINDYLQVFDVITNGGVNLISEYTVNVWFKETTNSGRGLIETNNLNTTGNGAPNLYVGLFNGNLNTYNVSSGYSSNIPYSRNGWNYLTITRKTGTNTPENVYINGSLSSTRNITTANSDRYLNFGVGYAGFFNGYIGSISAYNKILTGSDALQNFNATKSRFGL